MKRPANPPYEMFFRLCLLALLALSSCEPIFERDISGRVLSIKGKGQRRTNGQSIDLTTGSWFKRGDTIVSAQNSHVDLMILPGLLVELESESEIEIIDLRLKRDGYETTLPMRARRAKLRLLHGALSASVGRDPHHPRLMIETPVGTLSAASGRTFRLETTQDKIRVLSIRRKINFESRDGRSMQVQAGYSAEWPPTATGPQAAWQLGPDAQNRLNQVLETEKNLLRLERQNRFSLMPRTVNAGVGRP